MCKYIVLGLLVFLVALMVGAALVVQEHGWQGLLILLVVLSLLGYVVRKMAPGLLVRMLTRPLRQMGAALRGARLVVHSVTPCHPPPPDECDADPDDNWEAIEDELEGDEEETEDEGQPVGPLDWYLTEFTVVPPGDDSGEGRVVVRRAWTPQMIGTAGPRPPLERMNPFRGWPPDQFTWDVQNMPAEVWTGYDYEEAGKTVSGERRLRLRVGVVRHVRAVTITYAQFTDLGEVRLPRIDVRPGDVP